ncbi:hypothetical protein BH23GEM9_BH23GEM9_16380 [soil metagenome]
MLRIAAPLAAALLCVGVPPAHSQTPTTPFREAALVPPTGALTAATSSSLRDAVDRYGADRAALLRRHDAPHSEARRVRMREFYSSWDTRVRELQFAELDQEARVDLVLLRNEIRYQLALLDREATMAAETAPLLPFTATIVQLQESRRELQPIAPQAVANTLAALAASIDETRRAVEAGVRGAGPATVATGSAAASTPRVGTRAETSAETSTVQGDDRGGPAAAASDTGGNAVVPIRTTRIIAFRSAAAASDLRQTLQRWYRFYSGYDPMFTWWATEPYNRADAALESYIRSLRERVVGIRPGEEDPIIGDPIGADGLRADLLYEMIPYTPAQLVRIAEREFAWSEAQMKQAARDMGFGDDWKAALEKVKLQYVEPGGQTELTRMLAEEAIEFVESRDLLTVPPLAKEVWRMEMLSPQQQRTAPFYLGGEVIQVAFPTNEMTHEDKMMAMRGNNVHFSRAVVHHELIPGHHLQQYMTARYNPHRRAFSTPFWTEGWALYWEMLLWDLGFPQTPEDRVGMLFWRMHRSARIVFSLNVHLGEMTPDQAIDFLVDRVGHERANATAEVRRSLVGTYPPLYQAAYMLGGLQFRALHRELVEGGRMSNREFHDRILQGGIMPVEMVRARLLGVPLSPDYATQWRFAGDVR